MNSLLRFQTRPEWNALACLKRTRAFSLLTPYSLLRTSVEKRSTCWVPECRQSYNPSTLAIPSNFIKNVPKLRVKPAGVRLFHTTSPRNRPLFPNQPPFKVYTISPFLLLLAGVGFTMLIFAVLPFVFTFFFPMIIAGICAFQFSKWKRKVLFQGLLKQLKSSSMRVNYNTVKALHIKSLDKIVRLEQQGSGVFEDFLKGFDADLRAKLDKFSSAKADSLLRFLDDRLLEAIENNEKGMRSYFLGDDVNSWVADNYQLELDTEKYKTTAQMVDNELIMLLTFPLYLKSNSNPRKHLANVSLAILQGLFKGKPCTNYLDFLSKISKTDTECQMCIAVQPLSNLSTRLFVLTTEGQSGDWHLKYDAREDESGHTEYVIKSKE